MDRCEKCLSFSNRYVRWYLKAAHRQVNAEKSSRAPVRGITATHQWRNPLKTAVETRRESLADAQNTCSIPVYTPGWMSPVRGKWGAEDGCLSWWIFDKIIHRNASSNFLRKAVWDRQRNTAKEEQRMAGRNEQKLGSIVELAFRWANLLADWWRAEIT